MILKDEDKKIIRDHLEALEEPVTLFVFTQDDRLKVPGREPCFQCRETEELAKELAELSDRLKVVVYDRDADKELFEEFGIDRVPAMVPAPGSGDGDDGSGHRRRGIRFYGLPSGYEFPTLLETIIEMGRADGPEPLPEAITGRLAAVTEPVNIKVFATPT